MKLSEFNQDELLNGLKIRNLCWFCSDNYYIYYKKDNEDWVDANGIIQNNLIGVYYFSNQWGKYVENPYAIFVPKGKSFKENVKDIITEIDKDNISDYEGVAQIMELLKE